MEWLVQQGLLGEVLNNRFVGRLCSVRSGTTISAVDASLSLACLV